MTIKKVGLITLVLFLALGVLFELARFVVLFGKLFSWFRGVRITTEAQLRATAKSAKNGPDKRGRTKACSAAKSLINTMHRLLTRLRADQGTDPASKKHATPIVMIEVACFLFAQQLFQRFSAGHSWLSIPKKASPEALRLWN